MFMEGGGTVSGVDTRIWGKKNDRQYMGYSMGILCVKNGPEGFTGLREKCNAGSLAKRRLGLQNI